MATSSTERRPVRLTGGVIIIIGALSLASAVAATFVASVLMRQGQTITVERCVEISVRLAEITPSERERKGIEESCQSATQSTKLVP